MSKITEEMIEEAVNKILEQGINWKEIELILTPNQYKELRLEKIKDTPLYKLCYGDKEE